MIVQALQELQKRRGWLPREELRALSARLQQPLYRIHEVASFFPHFRLEEPPEFEVRICQDMSCHLRGAADVKARLEQWVASDEQVARRMRVCSAQCLGRCDRAPAAAIEHHTGDGANTAGHEPLRFASMTPQRMIDVVQAVLKREPVAADTDAAWIVQSPSDWYLDVYRREALQPYEAVRRFLTWKDFESREPAETGEAALRGASLDAKRRWALESLLFAGLLGMGGAGGRAYKKWMDVLNAADGPRYQVDETQKPARILCAPRATDAAQTTKPAYVVCNADESEPGTFKDREILLRAPHLVVEGVILAGLVVGAERGFIYIRHEFEEQIRAVREAIAHAESLNVCGENLLGTKRRMSVEVFVSPGGYICGEQTALIEVIEDRRAEPRNRPPELQTNGLWDCPTVVNNVETLAWTPAILLGDQGREFASQGAGGRGGRRFFSISGDVVRPGAYEVPVGITLRELIHDRAGGVVDGRPIKALALSGPSGGFLPPRLKLDSLPKVFVEAHKKSKEFKPGATEFDLLDMKLDIAVARRMNVMLGAGMVVFADGTDIVSIAGVATEFFRNESCGKCVPCRIGSQKLVELHGELTRHHWDRQGLAERGALVSVLADAMEESSICGLGQVASHPMATLLAHFPFDVERCLSRS